MSGVPIYQDMHLLKTVMVMLTEEQTATMEGLGETATRLEMSSENLRSTVLNFKVD